MTNRIGNRLDALEASSPVGWGEVHRLMGEPGQSLDDVLDCYGRDRIASNDMVIVRTIIEPDPAPD